jgi:hypothetical protein
VQLGRFLNGRFLPAVPCASATYPGLHHVNVREGSFTIIVHSY